MSENVVFTRVISIRHVSGAVSLYEPPCFSHVIPPYLLATFLEYCTSARVQVRVLVDFI